MDESDNCIRRNLIAIDAPAPGTRAPASGAAFVAGRARVSARRYKRGWWIRDVARPTLGGKSAELRRFSGDDMFKLYPGLKTAREGEGRIADEVAAGRERTARRIREDMPGFGLRDLQLGEGAWTLMRSAGAGEGLLSWTRVSVKTPAELGVEPYAAPPREAAATVKAAARLYGAALAGIAPMDERYVNLNEQGRPVVFDDVDLPVVSEAKFVIPRKMKWVVALAIPMDLDLLSQAPSAVADAASGLGYSHSAFAVASLAEFIRGLGYQAIPSVNDTAQSIPFAVDAGLGELSRMNKLVTPEFGAAVRLCKVFTDLPMACDRPVDFGVVEACKHCKRCAEACPAVALSFEDEPSFQTRGVWNNAGHKAWFEDSYRCFSFWQSSGTACAACLASCPFTQAAHAWVREAARVATSLTPATDGMFRAIEDEPMSEAKHDPDRWWVNSTRAPRRT
jgi:epoxyqueuosine reductase